MKKAVVLLSGGMDSAVTLYIAENEYKTYALFFEYGQKSVKEAECAEKLALAAGAGFSAVKLTFPWLGSALIDPDRPVPSSENIVPGAIPDTYVPGRNIIFLSYAVSYAEVIGAEAVFIGAHQLDYSNYPDCRDEFFMNFRKAVDTGTKCGVEGMGVRIETPIINMTKKDIILKGVDLGVPFEYTWSCYNDLSNPCGECESCVLRAKGFHEADVKDPLTWS